MLFSLPSFISKIEENILTLIIFELCFCQFSIGENLENSAICARFNVSGGKSYDLYDRAKFSRGLENIFDTEDFESFYSVEITEGCVAKICVMNFLKSPIRRRECHTLDRSSALNSHAYFYIVTTFCSCHKPTDECHSQTCGNVKLSKNECVRLFVEPECSECLFNSTSIANGSSLIPTNGFSTESFVVQNGCRLNIQSIGKHNQSVPDFVYQGTQTNIQLSYALRPVPSIFTCKCGIIDEDEPKKTKMQDVHVDDWRQSDPLLVKLLVSIPVAVLLIVLVTCLIKIRIGQNARSRILQEKANDEVIKRFEEGISEDVGNPVYLSDSDDPSALHYVSVGFTEALVQPYQSRYEVSRKDVEIGKVLEKGNFGIVFSGKLRLHDSSIIEVAIKKTKANASVTYFTSLLDEIKILSFIGSHPNIVSLVGACTKDLKHKEALLLLELCPEGSLKSYLKKNRHLFEKLTLDAPLASINGYTSFCSLSNANLPTILPEYFLLLVNWAKEIAAGMEYLSQKKVIHLDLAARNVLLTKDLVAKISDFGLSQRLRDMGTYVRIGEEYPLPMRWLSMEALLEQRFTSASDVWAYGVTLWEVFTLGENPYTSMAPMSYPELIAFLKNDGRLPKPLHATSEIYNQMYKCWFKDPVCRPTFTELHAFFETIAAATV